MVVAGIVAGITVGILEWQHTSLAANMPPPTPPPTPPSTQATLPQPPLNSIIDDAILTGLQVAEAFNNSASWIWSVGGAEFSAPGGSVVFSKTLPMGKANATTALVLLAADDECQLYINGKMVANKMSPWDRVILSSVPLDPGPNIFAINATNFYGSGGNPAGLRHTMIWSDATWRSFQSPPEGFAMQNIDDTDWEDAVVLDGSVWAGGW
ncbi:hypothetical protein BD779DRAFT_1515813 [Infundibulicybe gibba]|nr:hypothetical protein BD779DRAFT_1515813 [Infundibulicybe gibba]